MSQNKSKTDKKKERKGKGNIESTIIENAQREVPEFVPIQQTMNIEITQRPKREKFVDTHTRKTFWLRNELMPYIMEETREDKGAMTYLINELLTQYFSKRA